MATKQTTNTTKQQHHQKDDGIKSSSSRSSSGNMIPSGFTDAIQSQMIIGFVVLTVTYFAVIVLFDDYIQPWLNLPPSAPVLCPTADTECWRSDLLAFEITSGAALVWSGWIGFKCWHLTKTVHQQQYQTRDGRLFGYLKEGHMLTAIGTTFQLFDLAVSFLIPEQRDWIFLCHHIMAATVSWFGLNNQYFHYYGVFFLGCSEISTAPLIFIDLAKFFPPIEGSTYDTVVAICGPLFALSFTYYRVILWWKVSYLMFQDIFGALKDGTANKLRPGRNHVLYVMMGLNLLLGCLQLYWFSIILEEALKVLGISQEASNEL